LPDRPWRKFINKRISWKTCISNFPLPIRLNFKCITSNARELSLHLGVGIGGDKSIFFPIVKSCDGEPLLPSYPKTIAATLKTLI